jgi:hypothetical protein
MLVMQVRNAKQENLLSFLLRIIARRYAMLAEKVWKSVFNEASVSCNC